MPTMNNMAANPSVHRRSTSESIASKALFIYILACFFPYPGLEVGRSSGLQIAHVLGLLYTPLMLRLFLKRREFILIYFGLSIPSFLAVLFGNSVSLNLNAAVFQAFGLLTVPIVGVLVVHSGLRPVILAVIAAVSIHALIGILQQVNYLNGDFPLIWLYVNPSFAYMEPEATRLLYGVYTKRSFGVFPEPSSMFASLAPFMVLLIYGKKFYPRLNIRASVAIFLGLVLFYFSKSGGILYFLVACIPYVWASFIKQMKRRSSSKILYLLAVSITLLLIFWGFWEAFQSRAQSEFDQDDGSWAQRSASIVFALSAPFEGPLYNLIFGYGLGDVSVLAGEATGRPSVHSWLAQNFMGSGLVGTVALILIFFWMILGIKKSTQKLIGHVCAYIWLICVAIVTGYFQLLSVWAFFGILLAWRYIKWERQP